MEIMKEPMLACATIPDLHTEVEYPCLIQPKADGIRTVAINGVSYSRKMKPIPNKFIQKWFYDNQLHGIDGELMVRGDFNKVQSAVMSEDGEPDFYVLTYDFWDSSEPYTERMNELQANVDDIKINPERVVMIDTRVAHCPEQAEEYLQDFIDQGYEGGMLRKPSGKYKQGRSTFKEGYLLKLKRFLDDEAVVIGYEEKMTNTNTKETDERGYSKRSSKKKGLVPANTLGSLQVEWKGVIFNIGSGFNDEQRKEIWNNREKYLGKLVTFRFQELSSYNVPRFPTFKWFREEYN